MKYKILVQFNGIGNKYVIINNKSAKIRTHKRIRYTNLKADYYSSCKTCMHNFILTFNFNKQCMFKKPHGLKNKVYTCKTFLG